MWWFAATLRKGGGEGPNLHLLHSTMSESPYLQTELPSTFVAHVASQTWCPPRDVLNWADASRLTRCPTRCLTFVSIFRIRRTVSNRDLSGVSGDSIVRNALRRQCVTVTRWACGVGESRISLCQSIIDFGYDLAYASTALAESVQPVSESSRPLGYRTPAKYVRLKGAPHPERLQHPFKVRNEPHRSDVDGQPDAGQSRSGSEGQ